MRSDSSANPNEFQRQQKPFLGVLPPHERLHSEDLAARQRSDRLVLETQLAVSDRGTQVVLELEPLADLLAQAGVEDRDPAPAPRLRLEHRHVGVLQEARGVGRTVLEQHDPDARGDSERATG